MAWFSHLLLSLKKFLKYTDLCWLYQAWRRKRRVDSEKGAME